MRISACCCFALIVIAAMNGPAWPQDEHDSVQAFTVHVVRTQKQPSTGEGVYLGNGFVITAAHVAGLGFWRHPRVEIAGTFYPTTVVKDGHFHNVDLTILSVDVRQIPVSLGLRHMAVCTQPLRANEPVLLATPQGVKQSQVVPPAQLPPGIPAKYRTAVRFVGGSGWSGTGVFAANKKCLLGIITRLISQSVTGETEGDPVVRSRPIAKYFVPASDIAAFIPADVRY